MKKRSPAWALLALPGLLLAGCEDDNKAAGSGDEPDMRASRPLTDAGGDPLPIGGTGGGEEGASNVGGAGLRGAQRARGHG